MSRTPIVEFLYNFVSETNGLVRTPAYIQNRWLANVMVFKMNVHSLTKKGDNFNHGNGRQRSAQMFSTTKTLL